MTTTEKKLAYLRLARSQNVGPVTFSRLIEKFQTPENALEKLSYLQKQGKLGNITLSSLQDAEYELENTEKFGAEIITFCDPRYPKLLREISDAPPVITVKGDLDFFLRDKVAVVGPRNASLGALSFAKKMSVELGQSSFTTVSGMARGVDTAVHEASILSGTIAVVAGGIDHVYPRENERLYERIAKHGLLISENAFGAAPKTGNFVQRNRLVSGLSLSVIVVEAALDSGSLITARYAANQGRDVFAVPGSPFDPRYQGTNRLIKDGAAMVESIRDVLWELSLIRARFGAAPANFPKSEDEKKSSTFEQKNLSTHDVEEVTHTSLTPFSGDSEVKKISKEILNKIGATPIAIDEIVFETKAAPQLINIALMQLELEEKVEVNLGKVALRA